MPLKQENLLEEPGVGSRMGSNSEIDNKEVGNEDMDWNPKPDTTQKGPQRTEKGRTII